jgi:hypothetical protein
MKLVLRILFIAIAHILFMFDAYATNCFGLAINYSVKVFVWFGLSSIMAFILYFGALLNSSLFASNPRRYELLIVCAFVATLFSLYWGVVWCFNQFGT